MKGCHFGGMELLPQSSTQLSTVSSDYLVSVQLRRIRKLTQRHPNSTFQDFRPTKQVPGLNKPKNGLQRPPCLIRQPKKFPPSLTVTDQNDQTGTISQCPYPAVQKASCSKGQGHLPLTHSASLLQPPCGPPQIIQNVRMFCGYKSGLVPCSSHVSMTYTLESKTDLPET